MAKSRQQKNRRTKRMRGGGSGIGGYAFTGASIMPGLGNAAVAQPQTSCLSVARPGETSVVPTGLSGMVGGRYSFDLSAQTAPATPFLGGVPPVVAIPCEAARANPLNPTQLGGAPGGIGSPFYTAPTAGYSSAPSSWAAATGAPVTVQIPYNVRVMNPACLTTGGGKRKARKSRKNKSRKNKSRKH